MDPCTSVSSASGKDHWKTLIQLHPQHPSEGVEFRLSRDPCGTVLPLQVVLGTTHRGTRLHVKRLPTASWIPLFSGEENEMNMCSKSHVEVDYHSIVRAGKN